MRTAVFLFAALWISTPALAQTDLQAPANHYIDHLTLAINDFEKGIQELQERTGVKPRDIGRDALLGTQSAVVSLGEHTFLQVLAPDPKADPEGIDPELKPLVLDRINAFSELTPFGWAVGTHNFERSRILLGRAGIRMTDLAAGNLKKGWGRGIEWEWSRITRPDSRVTPVVLRREQDGRRPQDRAPGDCTLSEFRIFSRNYKLLHGLVAVTLLDVATEGAEEDALRFELACDGETVVFEPVSLMTLTAPPKRPLDSPSSR